MRYARVTRTTQEMGARLRTPPQLQLHRQRPVGREAALPACAPVAPNSTCQALGPAPTIAPSAGRRFPCGDAPPPLCGCHPSCCPPRLPPQCISGFQIYMCEQRGKVYRRESLRSKKGWGLGARRKGARAAKGQTARRMPSPKECASRRGEQIPDCCMLGRGLQNGPRGRAGYELGAGEGAVRAEVWGNAGKHHRRAVRGQGEQQWGSE